MKTILLTALLVICTDYASAQETAELYQAEIIVYRQIEAATAINQIRDLNHPLNQQHKERATLDLSQASAESDIQAIPTQRLQLTAEAQKIERDSRYQLLYHGGWQQPPYHRAQAPHINILKEPQNGLLKGTAWMSYERYFKLLLSFQYDPNFNEAAEIVDAPQTFSIPIHLERIMSDEELFYIDHPVIGVIAIITPISESQ